MLDSDSDDAAEPSTSRGTASASKRTARAAATELSDARSNDSGSASDSDGALCTAKRQADATAARKAANTAELQVVPADGAGDGDSTDTDDEFEAMDDHAKAEIRAMARKWLKSRKNQLNLLDAAYNRFTFNDEGLPRWFREDEAKHMRPMTGATRDELEAERDLLRAIDARPLKKVRRPPAHGRLVIKGWLRSEL